MSLLSRYKKLSFWNKLGVWGGLASIIGLCLFFLPSQTLPEIQKNENSAANVVVTGQARDIHISYISPPSDTKDAISALENKLQDASSAIELTKGEVQLLTKALRDLDQRTSGITKLPDGRTLFGNLVSGVPSIVLDSHNAAVTLFREKKYDEALEMSKNAIDAFEASKDKGAMATGTLPDEDAAKLYLLAASSAEQMKNYNLMLSYSEKADSISPTSSSATAAIIALIHLGFDSEVRRRASEAAKKYPQDPRILDLASRYGSDLQ